MRMELVGAGMLLLGAGAALWAAGARGAAGTLKARGNVRVLSPHRLKPAAPGGKAARPGSAAYFRGVAVTLVCAGAMIFWSLLVQRFLG